MLFLSFDTDRSGKMSSYELRIALKAAGESRHVQQQLDTFFGICLRVCVFAALFPWRHAAQQRAPAADLPEVRRRQLRHRLRRLPHLHRPSGEHVQYVTRSQVEVWHEPEVRCWNLIKSLVCARSLPDSGCIQEGTCEREHHAGKLSCISSSRSQTVTLALKHFTSLSITFLVQSVFVSFLTSQFIMLAMNVWGDAGRHQEPPEEQEAGASALNYKKNKNSMF